ncbi:unnamed protein product [Onchocerca flexuosa]|uniref:Uncharacterized protein n=1 Tax=Onchocerca flexuosa TaxID=387005 RepID=A0A183H3R5_9BILA|nr:unnamed protein product [Onchocerca flexuosa]
MIKDEFTKTNGLDYEEDCDVDLENDDGSSIGGTNEAKEESESTNDNGEEENDEGTASTSGNNLFLTQVLLTQRHKPNREAKILETSIANLKKKLQTQGKIQRGTGNSLFFEMSERISSQQSLKRASVDVKSTSAIRKKEDRSQITCRAALRITNEESTFEIENCSRNSFDEEGQTAVERSLAAMTKSKYSTSSCNSLNDIDDDDDEDNEESKNDAFLDRIFGESEYFNNTWFFFFFFSHLK